MANIITLRGNPDANSPDPNGRTSTIIATVIDSQSRNPVSGVPLTFSTATPNVSLNPVSGTTNAQGTVTISLSYPNPNPGNQLSGIAVITVVATDNTGASGQVLINFWNPDLSHPLVLSAPTDPITGLTTISYNVIASGLEVMIYLPFNIALNDLVTFFWDSQFVQLVYTGGPLYWFIPVNNFFIPEQALSPGDHSIWYMIADAIGNRTGSFRLIGRISSSPYDSPVLFPPIFPPELNGQISLAAAQNGVRLTLPLAQQPEISSNNLYRIFMRIVNQQGPQPAPTQIGQGFVPNPKGDVTLTIPYPNLQGLNGVLVDFYYTITVTNPQRIYTSTSTRMYVDTVPPGGNA